MTNLEVREPSSRPHTTVDSSSVLNQLPISPEREMY
jgi:hypothetical protein